MGHAQRPRPRIRSYAARRTRMSMLTRAVAGLLAVSLGAAPAHAGRARCSRTTPAMQQAADAARAFTDRALAKALAARGLRRIELASRGEPDGAELDDMPREQRPVG